MQSLEIYQATPTHFFVAIREGRKLLGVYPVHRETVLGDQLRSRMVMFL